MYRVNLSTNNVPPLASSPTTQGMRLVTNGEKCRIIAKHSTGTTYRVELLADSYTAELLSSEIVE